MFKKNTAVTGFGIGNFINVTTGATVTTGTPVEKRLVDSVGADCVNAATYNASAAQWEIDLAAADVNGDTVGLSFSLTDCLPISYTFKTVLGLPQSTIAATGDEMDFVDAPNVTGITAIQSGLGTEVGQASLSTQISNISTTGQAAVAVADGESIVLGTNTSGDYTNTYSNDGTYNEITSELSGTYQIDKYFSFNVGVDGTPVALTLTGYLDGGPGSGKLIDGHAWNWETSSWVLVTVAVFTGQNGDTKQQGQPLTLLPAYVNTGVFPTDPLAGAGAIGEVWIRFVNAGTAFNASTVLAIDQMIVSYSNYRQSIGYSDGRIWVDSVAGVAGSVPYKNGVAELPVDTFADAKAVESLLNTFPPRFNVGNGSTLAISGSLYDLSLHDFDGENWALVMSDSLDISDAYIHGATVSGICTSTTVPHFNSCHVGNLTCHPSTFSSCGIEGTLTVASTGDYSLKSCHADGNVAAIDFNGAGNTNVTCSFFCGKIETLNAGTGDTIRLGGNGLVTINANCTNLTLTHCGDFTIVDNGTNTTILKDTNTETILGLPQQIIDVLKTDTVTLPGQEAPPLNPTMEVALAYLYKFLRNKIKTDSTSIKVYADNESTVDHQATVDDDGIDFIRTEFTTGA